MGKFQDLTGLQVGNWIVLRRAETLTDKRGTFWLCECQCKNRTTRSVLGCNLSTVLRGKRGGSSSCGCLTKKEVKPGDRFGKLTVLELDSVGVYGKVWRCVCDCREEVNIPAYRLNAGQSRSCGCLRLERLQETMVRHGMANSRVYRIWQNMRNRCNKPKASGYKSYGGRGIRVCKEWDDDFYNFFRDMGDCKESEEIDRIDPNGPYAKWNCRWVDKETQANNKRNTKKYWHDGHLMSAPQWARHFDVSGSAMAWRLKRGEAVSDAVRAIRNRKNPRYLYRGELKSLTVLSRVANVPPDKILNRLRDKGWTVERATETPLRSLPNTKYEYGGKLWTLHELADHHNIKRATFCSRVKTYKWTIREAVAGRRFPATG